MAPGSSEGENYPCATPAAAHSRAGPAPRLGSTLEHTVLLGAHVSHPRGHESRKADPLPRMPATSITLPKHNSRAGPGDDSEGDSL